MDQDNPRLFKEFQRKGVRVDTLENNFPNTCVNHNLGAQNTGLVSNIINRTLDGNPVNSSLNQGVLLCMQTPAQFVALTRRNPRCSLRQPISGSASGRPGPL